MANFILVIICAFACLLQTSFGHNQPQYRPDQQHGHQPKHIPNMDNREQQQQQQQQQQFQQQHPGARHHVSAQSFGGDKEHIQEHLEGVVKPEEMTEDEIQFHYFKIHDYDGNNLLDGIELISALTDYHKGKGEHESKSLTEAEIEELVDSMMNEDDLNGDGYIAYDEYMVSQKQAAAGSEADSTS